MIGSAWNINNPAKPFAIWDPDADIGIPIGLADWLATDLGVGYSSHQVLTAPPLVCEDPGAYVDGVVRVRMALIPGAEFTAGVKYPFTIRVFGDDGTTKDDRTLWLQVRER
jgi:hypothetical protein